MKTILVVGGAGYIGSHTVIDLIENGYDAVIVDDFSNSSEEVINRLNKLTNTKIKYYNIDAKDYLKLKTVFYENDINAVINFAGYKSVKESVDKPEEYYENNIGIVFNLIKVMKEYNIKKFIFSSSATVYSQENKIPFIEDGNLLPINPYGRSKLYIEMMLKDICYSDKEWSIVSLRYFNPLGAHKSGEIGEEPNGIPNNLAPYITQVAIGKLPILHVFGNDYKTKDGTCIRDYIHISDLARGHRNSLEYVFSNNKGYEYINLGSGKGYSVFEVINAFENVIGEKITYDIVGRREGDMPENYANINKAKKLLNWEPIFDIVDMCKSAWKWQVKNPNGFTK
ncbi:UDP-glucose 4-epimerase GalE [Streptobacillus felis]|uniref:UDP-glucose 4-epimerase GalE n=1 Tax=Streptobacillus felis TaxID=1384509 RepID=UPI00082AAEE8|nr:UDP-glucose 4-epimerase GalE [Streptobacillus felis]